MVLDQIADDPDVVIRNKRVNCRAQKQGDTKIPHSVQVRLRELPVSSEQVRSFENYSGGDGKPQKSRLPPPEDQRTAE